MTSTTPVTSPARRRLEAFVAVLARTSGAEALTVGLSPYLALMVLAGVVFGGNGMRPHHLTNLALNAPGFRLAFLGAWLLLSMPAARAILAARSSFYLRCMPVPAWIVVPVLMAFMALVEVHWCWLWLAGEGPAGAGAVAVAIAGHALLVSRPSRPAELGIALALVALTATTARLSLWNVFGWPLAGLAVWRTWLSAPGRGPARARALVRRGQPRLIALAAAHLATLVRHHRALLVRWSWLAGAGAFSGILAVKSNGLEGTAARTLWLVCLLPGLLFGAAGLVGPLARTAAKANWMLLSCGVSAGQRQLAFLLALLPAALGLGVVVAALSSPALSWFSWSGLLELTPFGMLASVCAVMVAATVGLRSIQGKARDATDLLLRMAVVGGLLMLATWRFHTPGLLVTTALVTALGLRPETAREDVRRSVRIARQAD